MNIFYSKSHDLWIHHCDKIHSADNLRKERDSVLRLRARIRQLHTEFYTTVLHRHRDILFMDKDNLEKELEDMKETEMKDWLHANEAAIRSSARQAIDNSLSNVRSLTHYYRPKQPTNGKQKTKTSRSNTIFDSISKVKRSRKRRPAPVKCRKMTNYITIRLTTSRRSQSPSTDQPDQPEQIQQPRQYRQLSLLSLASLPTAHQQNASTSPSCPHGAPTQDE